MRALLMVSLVLNLVLLAVVFGLEPFALASAGRGGGNVATRNGDINADGLVDISDAVALLNWLFADGAAPAVIPRSSIGVPDTGQTDCYDDGGNLIDCGSEEWPGQDGFHPEGCPYDNRFIDNGNRTITDTCTSLMWEQGTGTPLGQAVTWKEALEYCDSLELGGHSDWRVPNVREMQSIIDYSLTFPAVHPVFESEQSRYWTSTTDVSDPQHAWVINALFGNVADIIRKDQNLAFPRAVRTVR